MMLLSSVVPRNPQPVLRRGSKGRFTGTHGPKPSIREVSGQQMHRSTVCQANPRRVAKVTKLIEREIGSLMLTDNVLMDITKPRSTLGDVRGTLCSCTGVHVTSDLQVVKVYVSVFTDDAAAKQHTLARLTGLSGYVRRLIGERVRLRLTPEIRFVHDLAVERGERVLNLIARIETDDAAEQPEGLQESIQAMKDDAAAAAAPEPVNANSPFLEGVGETEYDSDEEDVETTFFSADMFPDASPAEEHMAAARKEEAWKMRKGSSRFRKSRKKIVRP